MWVALGSLSLASGWAILAGRASPARPGGPAGPRWLGWWALAAGAGFLVARTVWTTTYLWLIPYACSGCGCSSSPPGCCEHRARRSNRRWPGADRHELIRVRLPGMGVDLTLDARPTWFTRRPTWADNDRMRTALRLLALAGGLALAAAVVLDIGWGDPGHAAWVLIGPLPFYAVGVVAFAYRPDNPVLRWLLAAGALFSITTLLTETLPPLVSSPGIVLVAQWLGNVGIVVLVGLVGLFPVGRPDHWVDRVVLAAVCALAIALPVLGALANPAMLLEPIPEPGTPTTPSPIFVERLAPLGPVTARLYDLFPLCVFAGVGLLALRYRRETAPRRRQIRILLVGWSVGPVLALISALLLLQVGPDALVAWIAYLVLWPVTLTLVLGSLLVALLYDGVFGIDRPARRRHVHSLLRGLIVLAVVGIAGGLGVLVGRGDRLRQRGADRRRGGGRPAAGAGAVGAVRRPVGVRRPAGRLRPAGPVRRGAGTGAGPRRHCSTNWSTRFATGST